MAIGWTTEEERLRRARLEQVKLQKELEAKHAHLDALAQAQMGALQGGIFKYTDPHSLYNDPFSNRIMQAPPPRVRKPGELTDKMLNEGVYSMPLSAARDLWRVKFGDQWAPYPCGVDKDTDEQILFLAQRLLENGCFEKADSVPVEGVWTRRTFVRLKEE